VKRRGRETKAPTQSRTGSDCPWNVTRIANRKDTLGAIAAIVGLAEPGYRCLRNVFSE